MWPRNKYAGPGGGLYTGPGGGLYTVPDANPYKSNWPPRDYLLKYLKQFNLEYYIDILIKNGF